MTENDFRKMALALPGAEERAHMNHPDFRAGGKVFASLGYPTDEWGMVKLLPEQQQVFIALDAKSFRACAGKWGERGCTNVKLASAKKTAVRSALELAHEGVTSSAKSAKRPARKKNAERLLAPAEISKRKRKVVGLVELLPEGVATPAGDGHFSLEAGGRRFGYLLDNHHGDGRLALNCKAARGVQAKVVRQAPNRYHIPKYVGRHGWIGLWLDLPQTDWEEVQCILEEAHTLEFEKRRRKS